MKMLKWVVVALCLFATGVVMGAGATKKMQKDEVSSEETIQFQRQYISQTENAIATCRQALREDLAMTKVIAMYDDMSEEIYRSDRRLDPNAKLRAKHQPWVITYVKCVSEKKDAILADSRKFMDSFLKADTKIRAREMMAQWMTTMDTISTQNGGAEDAKYKTLANSLKLDL